MTFIYIKKVFWSIILVLDLNKLEIFKILLTIGSRLFLLIVKAYKAKNKLKVLVFRRNKHFFNVKYIYCIYIVCEIKIIIITETNGNKCPLNKKGFILKNF